MGRSKPWTTPPRQPHRPSALDWSDDGRTGPPTPCCGSSGPTATGCSNWRPTPPFRPNTSCCAHYLGEPRRSASWSARSASICAASRALHGGWPLFHGGAFDISATVKAYFALKMIGDDDRRAAHGARARGDPGPRRGRARATSSPASCWRCSAIISWRGVPGDAGGDHASAALVPHPPVEDVLLGAHGDRAAAGAAGAEARARATRAACASTSCSPGRREHARPDARARIRRSPGPAVLRASTRCCAWPSRCCPSACASAPSTGPRPSSTSG